MNTLLIGDPFLVEEKFKSLTAQIQKKIKGEVPTQSFRLSETPLGEVLTQARTLPFLAAAQIFRIKEAERLKKEEVELLSDYLTNPPAQTFLIFEASAAPSEAVKKVFEAKGEVVALEDRERKSAAGRFLREKLKFFGKTMTPEAIRQLEEMVGEAPAFLDTLLEQILTYAGDEKTITEETVMTFEENWNEVNVFKLTDALSAHQPAAALQILGALFEENEKDAISLIGLIHWQIRRLWQGCVLLDEGASEAAILKKCKVYGPRAPYFLRDLKRLDRKKLERAIEGLFRLDWNLKTGRAEMPVALERWVVGLTT